jgi:serralysin
MPSVKSSSPVINRMVSPDYRVAALEGYFTNGAPLIWQNKNITYSFPGAGSKFAAGYGRGEAASGRWEGLNAIQKEAVRKVLAEWATVSSLTFTEVPDGDTVGDLRFGFSLAVASGQDAYAYGPSSFAHAGDVWLNFNLAFQSFAPGSANYQTLLHEVGHALGLSHPFNSSEARSTLALPANESTYLYTVMAYTVIGLTFPHTPMPYDILAIQHLYGVNTTTSPTVADNTYTFDLAAIRTSTIWDVRGTDTIEITNTSNRDLTNLSPATIINLSLRDSAITSDSVGFLRISIAEGVVIENVIATNGHDRITGNYLPNTINGKGGSDIIEGGGGIDTVVYSAAKSAYGIVGNRVTANQTLDVKQFLVRKPDGWQDALTGIERLQFSDGNVALDITGAAGQTARLIGAVFGPAWVSNKEYMGAGLAYLDRGGAYKDLMKLALDVKLGSGASNAAVVNLLYANLAGYAPGAADMNHLRGLLDSGAMAREDLGLLAADHALNQGNINLVGLAVTGIDYI